MNKIEKAYNKLTQRFTKKGFIPNWIIPIKIYKNTYTLLKAYCKVKHKNYNEVVNSYSEDYKDTNYIKTKYFNKLKLSYKIRAFEINAIADYPIRVSYKNVNYRKEMEIAYLLLHEWGHYYNKRTNNFWNEKLADKFAIRWTRKLIKEELINEY